MFLLQKRPLPALCLLFITSLTTLSAGCSGGRRPCLRDEECSRGQHCHPIERTCIKLCELDAHCTEGKCNTSRGRCEVTHTCTPRARQACLDGSIFWIDSCDKKGELSQNCGTQGCNELGCITKNTPQCGDGKCDSGEGCKTCAQDCPCITGQTCDPTTGLCKETPNACGNNRCDADKGETCTNCLQDCPCQNTELCNTATQQCEARDKICNNNGKCDVDKGESCENCTADCKCQGLQTCKNGACTEPNSCGNGTCETNKGETCSACPSDCKCTTQQECINDACKTTKQCDNNGTCDAAKGENCTNCPSDCKCTGRQTCQNQKCIEPVTCGDGSCETNIGENCETCPKDCTCKSDEICRFRACRPKTYCGNGVCEPDQNENCATCIADCPCPSGASCNNSKCFSTCGNGSCDTNKGENCGSCPQDCKCQTGQACSASQCKSLCPLGSINIWRCSTDLKSRQRCGASSNYKKIEETCTQGCQKTAFSTDDVCCLCKPGVKQCKGDELQECDTSCTKWNKVELCLEADNRFCGSFSKKCICYTFNSCTTPNAYRCSGNERQWCYKNFKGCTYWSKSAFPCTGTTPVCHEGKCCVCKPGQKRCNGFFIESCKTDCSGWETSNFCIPPKYCKDLICQ